MSLQDDVAEQSRLLKDEVVAAEFIAAEETIQSVGGVLDTLSQLGDIRQRQLDAFIDDHRVTAHELVHLRNPFDLARVGFDHCARRATHIAEGLGQAILALANEARSLAQNPVEVWTPFAELLRRDWEPRVSVSKKSL